MIRWFRQLDAVLRGDAARQGRLDDGPGHLSARGLGGVAVLLMVAYGAGVGSFAVIRSGGTQWMQLIASAAKMPLLFFLTLLVTLPSLYVFSALVGARLRAGSVVRLLVAMVAVAAAVLASFAPIVVFFGVSTTSYPFMKLLNVAMCGVAGLLALGFMVKTLRAMVGRAHLEPDRGSIPPELAASPPAAARVTPPSAAPPPAADVSPAKPDSHKASEPEQIDELHFDEDGPADSDRRAQTVFRVWVVLFAFVGVQMSWVLRPFIGDPDLPFAWLRSRESNFFTDVWAALVTLLGG